MLFILDKLLIVFIYVNVLFPRRVLAPGVPIGHALMALIVAAYIFYAAISRVRMPRRVFFYILGSFVGIAGLALASLLLGNPWENIQEFTISILILMLIPVLYSLFGRYRPERYAGHILGAVLFLAGYVCYLYWQCGIMKNTDLAGYLTNAPQSMVAISYPGGDVRISLINGGFLPGGLLMSTHWAMTRGRWYYAIFVAIAFALYVSQTLGLWIAGAFAVAVYVFFSSNKGWAGLRPWATALLLTGCLAFAVFGASGFFQNEKHESISQKTHQTQQALRMFAEKPLFGGGLGYIYNSFIFDIGGDSSKENKLLESSYPMILSSTGLFGAVVYGFIFLYYVFCCGNFNRLRPEQRLFMVAHLSVLVSGIGNPYIWSGGLGLFYMCFLAAAVERGKTLV